MVIKYISVICKIFKKYKMKLLTHNMLTSKCMKGVSVGYPLGISASDVRVSEMDFNPDFVAKMIPKLDWPVLYNAAESIGQLENLPKEVTDNFENDHEFFKKSTPCIARS
ncbi:hypothetical protein NQ314_019334 [Rhamnusium bicolor]|uniref:Uncharacterized protein n=1 Tax=Rhamnusium bicolor TaxID=1586634 RepID=A0AAV8WNW1_9CUCU|nr:hypothetical protein NQ314_019334 [Rhamnusium bicolor]